MKKFPKAMCSVLLIMSIVLFNCIPVMASPVETTDEDGFTLISESTYYDAENDVTITDRQYSRDVVTTFSGASGNGDYKNEKTYVYNDNTKTFDYWVSGHFAWNQDADTATVSNVQSGITLNNDTGMTFFSKSTTSGSNVGGDWFGNKYAYAQFTFTSCTPFGMNTDHKVYVDVNVKGDSKTK